MMNAQPKTGFRTYDLAVVFYHQVATIKLPAHLRDQALRASSSICLNLKEGSAKPTMRDRSKFYHIALGSFREMEAIIDLAVDSDELAGFTKQLGGHLVRLCQAVHR